MTLRTAERPRVRVKLAALALTAAFAAGACSGGSGGSAFTATKSGFDTAPAAKRSTAPDLAGKTVDGGTVRLSDYRGSVVVVNLWGSWCDSCRLEAKSFGQIATRYRDKGVRFLGINTRDNGTVQGRRFEKTFGITYPSLYDRFGKQISRFAPGTVNLQTIPSTILIDPQGKVAARSLGPLSGEHLESGLTTLLAESPAR
ncbi:TlpA family protein disulfide reductase [Streptomyces sp. CA-111067]|uniref:TlpA family protein disulfide reductase n=1 Tax=Streptomyces sp. CA-111067 TaxID=3240046 RepID=UPI003D95C0FA